MPPLTQSALAEMIDHTLLKADATRNEIQNLCDEALQHGFASVCVQPFRVAQAHLLLKGTKTKVCTVIGFPLGANRSEVKALEAVRTFTDGADEVDMVMNIGSLKDKNFATVENDIHSVVKAAQGRLVKVILETCLLTPEEITEACKIAETAGASFVKTSTGFGKEGATLQVLRLMHQAVGGRLGIKASGGIRDRKTALVMIEAGATRLGTSHGVAILNGDDGGVGY